VYGSPSKLILFILLFNLDDTLTDWVYSPVKIPDLCYSICDARYNVGICTMNEKDRDFWNRDQYLDELVAFHSNRFFISQIL
jgi:hypothetical protein